MTPSQKARTLVGKRVTKVLLRPFARSTGKEHAYNPVIEFDDGTRLVFHVQETEHGEYGVYLLVVSPTNQESKNGNQ